MNTLFLELPASMRWSYLRNAGDHFFPQANLSRLLKHYFQTKNECEAAVQKAIGSPLIKQIMAKQSATNGSLSKWKLICLSAFIRLTKPEIIVETGVAHGSSSAVILEALHENGFGKLYSIDLPIFDSADGNLKPWLEGYSFRKGDVSTVNDLNQVGWLVPASLRDRWELILGDSLAELPKLVRRIPQIDIFFHDSLHTYECMMQEFGVVWPHLKQNAFILADDIFIKCHCAIRNFAQQKGERFTNYLQLGVIRKCKVDNIQ